MRVALFQSAPCHAPETGLAQLDQALLAARKEGATLLVTPEMWLGGYNIPPDQIGRNAGRFDHIADQIAAIVARHGVSLVLGCAIAGADRPLNAALAFDGRGQQVARYAKCHLFGDLDTARFDRGDRLSPVFELGGLRVGLAICYDIEFPETARHLARRGAALIVVPTANMAPYDSVNRRLIPARAEENGVFVAYANLCGSEGDLTYCGLSCVCAPDGATLAMAGADPQLLCADIDPAHVTATQRAVPYLRDRRPELYTED